MKIVPLILLVVATVMAAVYPGKAYVPDVCTNPFEAPKQCVNNHTCYMYWNNKEHIRLFPPSSCRGQGCECIPNYFRHDKTWKCTPKEECEKSPEVIQHERDTAEMESNL